MERIVLEVDGALARAWKNTSPDLRLVYENKITDLLRELQSAEFDNLLDKVGKIAEENGLTEKELQVLLMDDPQTDNNGIRYEWWEDEDFVKGLDIISADLKSGKDKGFSLEESKSELLAKLRKNGQQY